MKDTTSKYLLMIEPDQEGSPASEPLNDEWTDKVKFLFAKCTPSEYLYKGIHVTKCGKCSDNHDWILPNGVITHSLCIYYMQYYRPYIPQEEFEKIDRLYTTYQEGGVSA